MRIAVVHGYFLGDSGSGIYVRELAKAFANLGHEVTLVCQEQFPEAYGFIDSFYMLSHENQTFTEVFKRPKATDGSCRCVRPDIHKNLLTYAPSSETAFDSATFQDASTERIEEYLRDNITALKTIFRTWPPDFVQTNHVIMQPYEVAEALSADRLMGVPFSVTVHGSALNFSLKKDRRLEPYFAAAAERTRKFVALSKSSAEDTIDYSSSIGIDIAEIAEIIPPGVDIDLFKPRLGKPAVGDTAVLAGRLLWTKGQQYAIAAIPYILKKRPEFKLEFAGGGPAEPALRQLITLLNQGNIREARDFSREAAEFGTEGEWGSVIPDMTPADEADYATAARGIASRITFLGHLNHDDMAAAFARADICLMPSVFPEAYGLCAIEGTSAGAVPVATYQTGSKAPLDILAAELDDSRFTELVADLGLTHALAAAVCDTLESYPTKDFAFRERLHDLAVKEFSWRRTALAYLA